MKKDFGAFELHEKIGSGGMASVYRGVQKSLDRKVVLKVLFPHLAEDEKLVQRFEREARAAAMMRHENIVQVIDCGRFEDVSYIAMEFVEGLDLKQWIDKHGTPPMEVSLLLLRDLAAGMEHAHQNRIVHRDIKPANVMFTPDGVIKIMDFGLARRGEESTAVTLVGSVLGTPAYMSPEQATGEPVDERSDIFSAGVVAYELLGGRRPFLGDSYSTVLRSVLTQEPPQLTLQNPLVPGEVVEIVHKMLQKDVTKRYARIGQVRTELETALDALGLQRGRDLLREYAADPITVSERLRKKRLARHLDQGIYFENMGLSKIDDALLEFQRVLHLDPENKTAREHLKKLEKERAQVRAENAGGHGADATVVMTAEEMAKLTARPAGGGAPPPPPARPAGRAAEPARAPQRAEPARAAKPAPAAGPNLKLILIGVAVVLVVAIGLVSWRLIAGGGDGSAGGEAEPPTSSGETGRGPDPSTPVSTSGSTETPPAPVPPVTPAGVGTLEIASAPPGARLLINGLSEAKKAPVTKADLPAGEYTVRAEKTGWEPKEERVTLAAGETRKLTVSLQPPPGATGTLVMSIRPYGSVYVNGKAQGQPNVVTTQASLKPGAYTVRAEHPSLGTKEWRNVWVEPNGTTNLAHDFMKVDEGTLKVSSPGGWAYVWLDNKNTGKTTPAEIGGLKPGSYSVTLVREGFTVQGGAKRVTIKDGVITNVEFKLVPQSQ